MYVKSFFAALTLAVSAIAAPTTTETWGVSVIDNKLSVPVWVWVIASDSEGPILVQGQTSWSKPLFFDPKTGTAIKIGTSSGAIAAGPLLHLSYSLNYPENSVYYDLSSINGLDPVFQHAKLTVSGNPGQNVPVITWDHLQVPPSQDTKAAVGDNINLTLTIEP